MSEHLLDRVLGAIGERMSTWPYRDGELIATPWTLEDGEVVTLYVQAIGEDLYNITDRGLAADTLAAAGVDLSRRMPHNSFVAIKGSVELAPAIELDKPGEYDLSASATAAEVGRAVVELSEAVLRAEGLKALARQRKPATLKDRIVSLAGRYDSLTVQPLARMPLRYKGVRRQVSCRVAGPRDLAFVQAVGRASQTTAYDHAKSIFSDASVPSSQRLAVIEGTYRLEEWQLAGLREVCSVVDENELSAVFEELSA
ncbi:DUF1828 domain-containing protein [Kribbella sp. NBC_00482]|uniref:DUF1828 domain-containing protein n=1 Tax=Kribbella sp. NBC_00482 TaxID=2975968 RepID=UPI002E19BA19